MNLPFHVEICGMARYLLIVLTLALVFLVQDSVQDNVGFHKDWSSCNRSLEYKRSIYSCPGFEVVTHLNASRAEITCNGSLLDCSKLPQLSYGSAGELRSLSVKKCALDSITCVLASLNASSVKTLILEDLNSPLRADVFRGLDLVETLKIFDTLSVQTVPVDVLKQLPKLQLLEFENTSLTTLPPNVFKRCQLPDLMHLHVTVNSIKILQAQAFDGLDKVKTLLLFGNNIEEIEENAFRGLDLLQKLNLDENNISVVPARVLASAARLQTLTLSRNKRALSLHADAFAGLRQLREIEMEESNVTSLPANLFHDTTALVTLILRGNELKSLPPSVFATLARLVLLDLSNNKLESVDQDLFQPLQEIREIRLNHNHIQVLGENIFSNLQYLITVNMSENRIDRVNELDSPAIALLDLSSNQLPWCYRSEGGKKLQSPLKLLIRLENLNLSNNQISDICSDWMDMPRLKNLNLSFNNLTQITAADIKFKNNKTNVDLRDNRITTVELPTNLSHAVFLKLGRNPFQCDCRLYPLLRRLKHRDVNDATCHLPNSLNNCSLDSIAAGSQCGSRLVSVANLTCPIQYEVPPGCACLVRPAENRTECDCDDLTNKTLPDPTLNGGEIDRMLLRLRSVDNALLGELEGFVNWLDLSGLGLETVPYIPVNVTYVDLSRNKLSRVPAEVLRRNLTLKLEKNPLKCECSNVAHIANLQKYRSKIRDYTTLLCKGEYPVREVDVRQLCQWQLAVAIIVPIALAIIILAITIPLSYKYSLEIRIWLAIHMRCTCLIPDEAYIKDWKRLFDVFLSYVHQNEEFVKSLLLPQLEKMYKVCIHTRDWIPGAHVPDQIYRSVAESRRTLIVLSKEYLQSVWAQEEFRASELQASMDGRQRSVVIVLGDVNLESAPEHIQRHIKLNTYIKWGDDLFWERLQYAVPPKLNVSYLREYIERRKVTENAVKTLANGISTVSEEIRLMNLSVQERTSSPG